MNSQDMERRDLRARPSRRLYTFIPIVVGSICFVGLVLFYALCYSGHILWQEQNQIFLNTPDWIATYFSRPAWLGCLAGDWLTQFYHNVWIGACILALTIAASVACFAALAMRLLPKLAAWVVTALFAVLIVGCSMAASTSLSFFLCILGGMALGLSTFTLSWKDSFTLDLSPLLVGLAYWAFGFGALLTALIIILLAIKRLVLKHAGKLWWLTPLCAVVVGLGLPAILCGAYALPYSKALLYPGIASPGLPQMKYERRLAISDAWYQHDLDRATQLAMSDDTPDDVTAFYYYLSSAVQDSLPDNLLK